ncbi:MAG: hypothetical protein ACOC8L_14675 [Spirochaetota bacterium]
MIASTEANATVRFYTVTETSGWDGAKTVTVTGTHTGRITTLSDNERISAQTLERNSTHRFYTEDMDVITADRAAILSGDYAGDYRVRATQLRRGGGIAYQQADLEYFGLVDSVPAEVVE